MTPRTYIWLGWINDQELGRCWDAHDTSTIQWYWSNNPEAEIIIDPTMPVKDHKKNLKNFMSKRFSV